MLLNVQTMVPIRNTLIGIDHLKPENGNPLKSDIKTGVEIVHLFMKTKHSRSWDMKYHWLENCTKMVHLNNFWEQVINNWSDYFTKHHPLAYHKIMRYKYLQTVHIMTSKFMNATQYARMC